MWTRLWQTWTIDKPAALGDWLWQILVVDLAAFLDRLTLRRVVALIPVVILVLAYLHRIPLPPELMLLGDLLAYIDIFSMIWYAAVDRSQTWVWYVSGIILGALIIALFAVLEKRRNSIVGMVEKLRGWN